MVRKTFGIYSEELSGCILYIETGIEYIACWCKKNETKEVKAFELFSFAKTGIDNFENLLRDIRSQSRLLTSEFENVYCIWGDEKCVCIPREFYKDELSTSYMEMMFGEFDEAKFCRDTINDCVTLGHIPAKILSEYGKHYKIAGNVHKYYQLLKGQHTSNKENKVHLVFYHSHFILSVYKESSLQLIQNFPYKTPADALYYVLNIFNTHDLSLNETPVHASGMIDTASPLYGTLRAYVNHFFVDPADKNLFAPEGFHDYPLHYFSSFCEYDV